jgi:hypothetical protein
MALRAAAEARDAMTFAIRLNLSVDEFTERLMSAFERAHAEFEAARAGQAARES